MIQEIEQTEAEKLEMYLEKSSKKELAEMLIEANKQLERLHIPVVSTRYIVAEEKEDIFEQLTCCIYDNLNDAQNFADAMADSLDYWDKKIVILNVC